MRERKIRWGRVILAAALAVLLFGCVYGRPGYYAGGDPYSGYYGGADPYSAYVPPLDPGQVIGPAAAGIEQIPVVGPLLDALSGGVLGYYSDSYYYDPYYNPSYNAPYYNDRSYNDRYYNDRYYNDRCYNDRCYDGQYGYDPNYRNYPNGYDNRYYGEEPGPYYPSYPR